ncbi:hypothetical protein RHGRI_031634 [Rhododendron griersonianum]|uniref:Protein kinase domain-containing protein n=1 Tax=Rhododendron griersonianum TaxID=479676 RepID=A0AAV6IBP9_9ERIC|nr:hypothetical protein RHGRI_031634 [Rhododendron griersonianum]
MGSFPVIFTIFLSCGVVYGIPSVEFLYPNSTASNLQYVDTTGGFLFSRNGKFKAAMFNPGAQQTNFYLCVIHAASNTITWTANRDASVSNSGTMSLTNNGVIKMKLHVGTLLSSSVSSGDLSIGVYRLSLSASDAFLMWHNMTFWKLSMDTMAYGNSNLPVEYMAINRTGLYLFGQNSTVVVIQVSLSPSNFRIAKMDVSGQFIVSSFSRTVLMQELVGPVDKCQIPFICRSFGLCSINAALDSPVCSCPSNFESSSQNTTHCVPSDGSYSLPVSCTSTVNKSQDNSALVSYLGLGYGIDYFANYFTMPSIYGINLTVCQDRCSGDCSCLGIFYENSSEYCYMVQNKLGSIMFGTTTYQWLGFIKVLVGSQPPNYRNNGGSVQRQQFPMFAIVLFSILTAFCLLGILGLLWWRSSRIAKPGHAKHGFSLFPTSSSLGDLDAYTIPGLPMRFEYAELEAVTDYFKNRIGSGGFGSVYKGLLPDKSLVAVKRISSSGVEGDKDFCTEIEIIGNIHHVNLVKLRGFCAQGSERLLVYEYMNGISLDRTLFGNGPVLKWQERVDIALGATRGLAYLH